MRSDDGSLTHWFGHSTTDGMADPIVGSGSDSAGDSTIDGGGGN
jgi:hypothetical protein